MDPAAAGVLPGLGGQMYGTTMIGTLISPNGDFARTLQDWVRERGPEVTGFVDARVQVGDDGRTVVNTVRFATREDYVRLADDPRQAEWYAAKIAPLLEGEPRWIDGDWYSTD